jgi:hypothetical protein
MGGMKKRIPLHKVDFETMPIEEVPAHWLRQMADVHGPDSVYRAELERRVAELREEDAEEREDAVPRVLTVPMKRGSR